MTYIYIYSFLFILSPDHIAFLFDVVKKCIYVYYFIVMSHFFQVNVIVQEPKIEPIEPRIPVSLFSH